MANFLIPMLKEPSNHPKIYCEIVLKRDGDYLLETAIDQDNHMAMEVKWIEGFMNI